MDDLVFLHSNANDRCAAIVNKHFEGYHTLQLMTAGAVDLYYDDEFHPLRQPAVWTAFPGPHIRFHLAPGAEWWSHRYAAFTGPRIAHWVAEGLWFQGSQPVPVAKFEHLFEDLLQHTARTDTFNRRAATNILERILIELAEARERQSIHPIDAPWLGDVLSHLETHFSPDYAALARSHGLSVSTLRRRFLESTGKPIHTAAVEARISRARNLLTTTDQPLKAIAASLGYADEYFFARQFKAAVGVPPAAFRRSRQ